MRIIFTILILSCYLSDAYAVSDVESRRIEEEKRLNLKQTEAQFRDEPQAPLSGRADSTQVYLESLSIKRVATHEDAARVLSILMGKEEEWPDFQARRMSFQKDGLLTDRKADNFAEEIPLRRGFFAQMLFKSLGLKGGLTLRVVGPFERYALAELVHENIMIAGSTREWMSGRELVYTFVQAVEFISKYKIAP